MNYRGIEYRLKAAVSDAVPDIWDTILADLPDKQNQINEKTSAAADQKQNVKNAVYEQTGTYTTAKPKMEFLADTITEEHQSAITASTNTSDFEKPKSKSAVNFEITRKIVSERKRKLRMISSLAAALLIFIGGFAGFGVYRASYAVDSTIGIEVNPCIELMINKSQTVLDVNIKNEDAVKILDDMDLKGSNLDVAVNALIGSMLRNGYITELANSILISVENKDSAKAHQLQQQLTEEINSMFASSSVDGAVLSQTVNTDSESGNLASQYSISNGKAALIQDIVSKSSRYTFEQLSSLSINDLALILQNSSVVIDDVLSSGTASEKAYIGRDAAKTAALSHAGAALANVYNCEVELDSENNSLIYEVEFTYNGIEYEYEIDAVTGSLLHHENSISRYSDSANTAGSSGGSFGGSADSGKTHKDGASDDSASSDHSSHGNNSNQVSESSGSNSTPIDDDYYDDDDWDDDHDDNDLDDDWDDDHDDDYWDDDDHDDDDWDDDHDYNDLDDDDD